MKTIALILCFSFAIPVAARTLKGAEYRSLQSFTYGRFETRIKSALGDGMLTSFFTYNDAYPATPWNEIDIEILGRYSDDIQFNPITPGPSHHVSHYQAPFSPAADYHVYAFEWAPAYVAWFIDGNEVYRATGPDIEKLTYPQKIMMNLWPPDGDSWAGLFTTKSLPIFTWYDWASYASYTPGSGTAGTGNNFTPQWKDEFDSLDHARWEAGNHTFSGNGCDFIPGNIVFRDGKLILCLTSETATGYTDLTPPSVLYGRAEPDGVFLQFSEEVDSVTATNPATYVVTGMSVHTARLRPDRRSVFLTLTGYDTSAIQNVLVFGLKDRWTTPNTTAAANVILARAHPLTLPVRVNCGGPAVGAFLADQPWGPAVEYGYMDGGDRKDVGTFSGTEDQDVYQTQHASGARYRFRLPNGRYDLTLDMAEVDYAEAGRRVFSVVVEGKTVISDLDIFALVGKFAAYRPSITNVNVTDGILEIMFVQKTGACTISGITITSAVSSVGEEDATFPGQWSVGANYPNPFNGQTVIPLMLSSPDDVSVTVFDVLGRQVSVLTPGRLDAGRHLITWQARDGRGGALASGVYYGIVKGHTGSSTLRMLLVQ